jgi:hypothetical protein
VDPGTREVAIAGCPTTLTAREFDLLYYLASNSGRTFTRAELMKRYGTTSSPPSPAPSTCICAACARRSRRTLLTRATCKPCGVWATGRRCVTKRFAVHRRRAAVPGGCLGDHALVAATVSGVPTGEIPRLTLILAVSGVAAGSCGMLLTRPALLRRFGGVRDQIVVGVGLVWQPPPARRGGSGAVAMSSRCTTSRAC